MVIDYVADYKTATWTQGKNSTSWTHNSTDMEAGKDGWLYTRQWLVNIPVRPSLIPSLEMREITMAGKQSAEPPRTSIPIPPTLWASICTMHFHICDKTWEVNFASAYQEMCKYGMVTRTSRSMNSRLYHYGCDLCTYWYMYLGGKINSLLGGISINNHLLWT